MSSVDDNDFEFDDDSLSLLDAFCDSSAEDIMIIAVAVDPETWLPQVVVGLPVEEPEDDLSPVTFSSGYAPITMNPEEAYQVGAYLIQAAAIVSSFYVELKEKTVEERKEIIELESQLFDSFPSF